MYFSKGGVFIIKNRGMQFFKKERKTFYFKMLDQFSLFLNILTIGATNNKHGQQNS